VTEFVAVMKREDNVRPAKAGECAVRAGLALDLPTQLQERGKNASGF
jgi:hypothetical protein